MRILILIGVLSTVLSFFILNTKNTDIRLRQTHEEEFLPQNVNALRDGDIIFQTSRSNQSKAIQLATKSKYSHCGLIFLEGEKYFVLEAVQTVKKTPLEEWIRRGEDGKYVVKRLVKADELLTPESTQKMKAVGKTFIGKNYDLAFEWSDDKLYCSELIWKVYYEATGLEIGTLERLVDFDLRDEIVKIKLKERYGSAIPLNEQVISPVSIFESDLLQTVQSFE